jgi:hypothetical protein
MASVPDSLSGVPRRISFSSHDFEVDTKPLDREALRHLVKKAEPSKVEPLDVHISVRAPMPEPIHVSVPAPVPQQPSVVIVAPPRPPLPRTVLSRRPQERPGFVETVCRGISIAISFLLMLALAAGVATFVVH